MQTYNEERKKGTIKTLQLVAAKVDPEGETKQTNINEIISAII